MYQFFVSKEQMNDSQVLITGQDFNHMRNVVRLKPGEKLRISDENGKSYFCILDDYEQNQARAVIQCEDSRGTELRGTITLLQGLPKSDKMDLIIQKAVELGINRIIPVITQNAVVKLDEKKEMHKRQRWQAIAEAAAKQSKRSVIPIVMPVMDFKMAMEYAKENCNIRMIPYENENGISASHEILTSIMPEDHVAILIGPEGGFTQEEISLARESMVSVSLGRRILRTETAAIAMMTLVMYQMERD